LISRIVKAAFFIFSFGVIATACGDDIQRDDSWDREQLQKCLDEGNTPLYTQQSHYNDTVTITFIACDPAP